MTEPGPRSLRAWLVRPWVFHPLLVGIPPILAFTRHNWRTVEVSYAAYSVAWTMALAAVLMLLLQQILGGPRKAGVVTSLWVIGLHAWNAAGEHAQAMAAVISVATLVVVAWRGTLAVATAFFDIFAVIVLAMSVIELSSASRDVDPARPKPDYLSSLAIDPHVGDPAELPDIYLLVLDGHGREDVLTESYAVAPGFADRLEGRGFYVAREAHSNYAQTALSLASSLNMDLLPALLDVEDPAAGSRLPLKHIIAQNRVVHTLKDVGYDIVTYPGEYSLTAVPDADVERRPLVYLTEYEYVLLGNTAIPWLTRQIGLPQGRLAHAVRRNHIQYVLDDLADGGASRPGPTFVFAHLVVPHPPFVFKPDGSYRKTRGSATLADGDSWKSTNNRYKEKYQSGYRDQVAYLDSEIERVIDRVLAQSERPPVIIVQGDHGPGANVDWKSQGKSNMRERMAVLNAVYFPDGNYAALYPRMTLVNTFRVVFNHVLGTRLPLTDDQSYFSLWASPFRYANVTEELQ